MAFLPDRRRIHKFDWLYWILKPWVNFSFRQYFSKIQIVGREKIPENQPVIFAPNHQNALMDALAVLYATHGQPVFLARADIFSNPLQARILHFLKIMPVFRIRDGAENLGKNDETFQAALHVLRDHHQLCLMPEGNHGDKRRLRPLVKGIFRIAFLTQEELGDKDHVQIVPVGIDYEHYQKFRKTLLVTFGDPIDVQQFMPLYIENKPRAFNAVRDLLAQKLRDLMIDIRNDEFYDTIHELRFIYTPAAATHVKNSDLLGRFREDQKLTRQLDELAVQNETKMWPLASLVQKFREGVTKMKLRYWLFRKGACQPGKIFLRLVLLILALPVFLYGVVHNIFQYWFPVRFIKIRKVKDPQFHSSFKFVLGFLLFPVVYLLFFLTSLFVFPRTWMSLLYLISLPVSGWLAFQYYIFFRKTVGCMRFAWKQKKNDPALADLVNMHNAIIESVTNIMQPS